MKIVHINTYDISGGAARVAYRLHSALNEAGHDSQMLVGFQSLWEKGINTIDGQVRHLRTLSDKIKDRVGGQLNRVTGTEILSYNNSWHITQTKAFREADIINLHNLHGGYFNIRALYNIAQHKPLVWTLHDMNSFTGHCAYSYDCGMYVNGCGDSCPIPMEYPRLHKKLISFRWRYLKKMLEKSPFVTAVVPSLWLYQTAKEGIWKNNRIELIPYGVDTSIFKPCSAQEARKALGLKGPSKYILFLANSGDFERKGGKYLVRVLNEIKNLRVALIIVGQLDIREKAKDLPFEVYSLGPIKNDQLLRLAYCAADIIAFPSLADNLPYSVMEAMTCGVPAVSFNIGGVTEMVRHMDTGYSAAYKNSSDFAAGVKLILSNNKLRIKLSKMCMDVAKKEYSASLMAQKYLILYDEVIRGFKQRKSKQGSEVEK